MINLVVIFLISEYHALNAEMPGINSLQSCKTVVSTRNNICYGPGLIPDDVTPVQLPSIAGAVGAVSDCCQVVAN